MKTEETRLRELLISSRMDVQRLIYPRGFEGGRAWCEVVSRLKRLMAELEDSREENVSLIGERDFCFFSEGLE